LGARRLPDSEVRGQNGQNTADSPKADAGHEKQQKSQEVGLWTKQSLFNFKPLKTNNHVPFLVVR
jgi:hypothetical protein